MAQQFKKKIPPRNRVYQTWVRVLYYPSLFTNLISTHASLTLNLPHASASLMPHASLTTPPPSCLMPHASCLPHDSASASFTPHTSLSLTSPHVTPPSASPHASPPEISNPPCSSFLSLAWGVQREDNFLSLWFEVCKFLEGEEAWFLLFIQISSILSHSSLPLSLSFESLLSLR